MAKEEKKNYSLTPEDYLSKAERKQLMSTCRTQAEADLYKGRTTWPKRYMIVDLALYSGLRVSEIASLTIGDLSLSPKDDAYLIVRNGKGAKVRTVYIDQYLAGHLTEYIDYKQKSLGHSVDADDPLFKGRDGHSPPITFMKSFKKALEKAGIPVKKYSIHNCRHTYATWLLKDTGELRYVQQQLGHSQREMTQLYAKILPEDNARKANMIQRPELEM